MRNKTVPNTSPMGRPPKPKKAKEPVRIRRRKLANGNIGLYLDIYQNGLRKYEALNLFLIPENTPIDKMQNENTLKIAEKLKAERVLMVQSEGLRNWDKVKRSSLPLLIWLQEYEEEPEFSESTRKGRKEMRSKLTDYLKSVNREGVKVKDVDVDLCRGFVRYLRTAKHGVRKDEKATISQGAAQHHQAVFNGALSRAVRLGLLAANPMKGLEVKEKIAPAESDREFLTIPELKILMNTPCCNEQVKRAFLFSCLTGLRLSDVRAMTWSKVMTTPDGLNKYVKVFMKKTKKFVNVPLTADAIAQLYPKDDPNEAIFTLPQTPTVCHDLKQWVKAANIKKHITFHCARHTFATTMLTLGVDLYTTSGLLGHSNITTTQIYAKIVDEKKVTAVHAMDKLFD